jgi:hypothetical protein
MKVADPRDVLIAPVISEKSYGLLDQNKYTFIVHPDANKTRTTEKASDCAPAGAWASERTRSGRSSASPRVTASTSSGARSADRAEKPGLNNHGHP